MKKLKWFTLVEILIVIVIIGILIWALVPRMQWAQWRARDVARKNDLNQLQSAILVAQQDNWQWPGQGDIPNWTGIDPNGAIADLLITAGLNSIPVDPLTASSFSWLGSAANTINSWYYGYILVKKDWVSNWWFALMAKTETPWWSNYVVCGTGVIDSNVDTKGFKLCPSLSEGSCDMESCTYNTAGELRYVLVY